MAFRYHMTDSSRESLERRIKEAERRGDRQYGEIKPMGHNPMIAYGNRRMGKANYEVIVTGGKFGVTMEKGGGL
ncbi:hypothetical protein [Peribacillus asahii]|uniref:hypothetical protein n=1 Tax=Peribacillus asahii TaxID=228899 RepID=UPI00382F8ED1